MLSKIKNQELKVKSVGGFSAIALLVVVVAIALSLVAVFVLKGGSLQQNVEPLPAVVQDPQVKSLETLSNSDEVSAIDKDTNDTNLDNIDEGVNDVDKQIPNL